MSWPTARTALVALLDGLTVTATGHKQETLAAYEYAPGGRQDASGWPYAFPLPTSQTVARGANGLRITEREVSVRIMLAPPSQAENVESIHTRYEAWCEELKDALDDFVALDGNGVFGNQDIGALTTYDDIDHGWGLQLTLGTVRIHEAKTFS